MAKYWLSIKVYSRGNGSRATRLAAYRAGERIHDERSSETYNNSARHDVVHKEIVLPSLLAGRTDMNWARDRSTLWNAAEHAGHRRNSRLAREVLVLLPPELSASQRTELALRYARRLADRYQNAVDLAVHLPRPGSDQRAHHAHLMMTVREVTSAGFGYRTHLEMNHRERNARSLGPYQLEYPWIREQWAQLANEALRDAGLSARIDHRSYEDRGIDSEPTPAMPQAIYYSEKKSGLAHPAGEDIRKRYRERVEARLQGPAALAGVLGRQNKEGRRREIERSRQRLALPPKVRRAMLTREERNEIRRGRYRARSVEINRKRREERQANREEDNRKRREKYWANVEQNRRKGREARRANAAGANRKLREWRKAHAGEYNRKRREKYRTNVEERRRRQHEALRGNAAEAEQNRKQRESLAARDVKIDSAGASASESAGRWLKLRETARRAPTADESAKRWLELQQKQNARSEVSSREAPKERKSGRTPAGVDDTEGDDRRKRDRGRDRGHGL